MNYWTLLAVLISSTVCVTENMFEDCDVGTCEEGEKFNVNLKVCQPCDLDTYIDISNHSCEDCRNCTRVDRYDSEILVANCTAVSDTVIGCHRGYFMFTNHLAEMDVSCEICTQCGADEVVEQNCTEHSDTVCATRVSPRVGAKSRASSGNLITVVVVSGVALLVVVIVSVFVFGPRRYINAAQRRVQIPYVRKRTETTMSKALIQRNSTTEL